MRTSALADRITCCCLAIKEPRYQLSTSLGTSSTAKRQFCAYSATFAQKSTKRNRQAERMCLRGHAKCDAVRVCHLEVIIESREFSMTRQLLCSLCVPNQLVANYSKRPATAGNPCNSYADTIPAADICYFFHTTAPMAFPSSLD